MTVTPQTENSNAVKIPVHTSHLIGLIGCVVLTLAIGLGGASPAWAQLAAPRGVDILITSDQPGARSSLPGAIYATPCDNITFPDCPAGNINVEFGTGVNRVLQAVIAGGSRFEPARELLPSDGLPDEVVFRRNAGAGLPERESLFYEYDGSSPVTGTLNLFPNAAAGIVEAMRSTIINRGIDDVFNNTNKVVPPATNGDETSNNIQRVDYIVRGSGIQVPPAQQDDVGFLILERGGNDDFGIAAITAIDGFGTPTAYGPLVRIDRGLWGSSTDVRISTGVLRRDSLAQANPGAAFLVPSPQFIQGIFFPISSLLSTPQNAAPIFGYSLFAADVDDTFNLTQPNTFPTTTTSDNGSGGLDLIAGGFGLVRRATLTPTGSLSLVKRITNLFGPADLPNFNQFVGDGEALTLLRNNNLGQGLDVITDPAVQAGDGIEYTVYLANSSTGTAANAVVCDQIPVGLTFDPNGFGPGIGIQAIAASSPPGPLITFTNADDGDAGRFIAPGAALPSFCGTNQGNGAVVVNAGDVAANQVGLIRFRTTVN